MVGTRDRRLRQSPAFAGDDDHCAIMLQAPHDSLEKIDTARIPGTDDELRLMRRGKEFSIMLGTNELMNSRLSRLRGGARDARGEEDREGRKA